MRYSNRDVAVVVPHDVQIRLVWVVARYDLVRRHARTIRIPRYTTLDHRRALNDIA